MSKDEIKLDVTPKDLKSYYFEQQGRYRYLKGYKLDRWIFITFMWLIFAYLFYTAYSYNFDMDYYECNQPAPPYTMCKNPFYEPTTWKNLEWIEPGSYGHKPGKLYEYASGVAILGILLAFVVNHIIWNRKKK
jgi:hypothetical protein